MLKNIFKTYKLWWIISTSIFSFFFFNLVMYAITGLSFTTSSSELQVTVQAFLMVCTGFVSLIYTGGGAHRKDY